VKKAKHFEGGGGADRVDQARYDSYDNSPEEAALKERGLKLSKGEGSGLGRLFMGDIDRPGSEAYNKYGAGRAKAEDALNVTRRAGREEDMVAPVAPPAKPPVVAPAAMVDRRMPQDYERNNAADYERNNVNSSRPTTVRPPVQVKPSGANKPIGPRGSASAPSTAAEMPASNRPDVGRATQGNATKTPSQIDFSGMESGSKFTPVQDVVKNTQSSVKPKSPGVGYRGQYTPEEIEANQQAAMDAVKGAGSSLGSYLSKLGKRPDDKDKGKRTYRDFSGKMVTYAKGGSVSSASSRGDGIAQRGKTRGRVL
jgi:hypothetical protein